jgi:hypothetical protein
MDYKELQAVRRVFLLKLYDVTGGDRWTIPSMFEIGQPIGIDDKQVRAIATYLHQKGFIKIETKDGDISITASGVDEAESYLEEDDVSISPNDISTKLDEINKKLDLLALGHELLYTDIMDQLEAGKSIQMKDLKIVLIKEIFSRGLDALKIAQFLDLLRT